MRGHSDRVHNEVVQFLDDMDRLISPLIEDGWKWALWVDPARGELKYWIGNADNREFLKMVTVRLCKGFKDNREEWERFKKDVEG